MVVVGCVVVFVGVVAAVVAVVLFGLVLVAFVVARWGCCSCRAFCQCCVLFSFSCSSRVPSLAALKDLDCILFGGLLGCRLFPWVLEGAPGPLGGPFGGSKAFPEGSWVPLGGLGGLVGGAWAPPGAPGGPPWGLWAVLGGPLGDLGAALGARGASSEGTFGNQTALQNHWFYRIKWYILALGRVVGGPWGGQVHSDEGPKLRDETRGTSRGGLG